MFKNKVSIKIYKLRIKTKNKYSDTRFFKFLRDCGMGPVRLL